MRAGTISAAMVLRLVQLLEQRRMDPGPLLHAVGLERRALEVERARVPYAIADRLMVGAARLVPPAQLGLALGLTRVDEAYGAAGLLLLTAPTFREGLRRAFGYQRLWGDGERFRLHATADGCAVSFRHAGPSRLAGAIAAECAFVEVLEGVRAMVERDATPLAVELAHEPLGDVRELSDHLRVEPSFARDLNRIVLPAGLVDRPLHALRELLTDAFERQAARALSLLPRGESIVERVGPLLSGEAGVTRTLADVSRLVRMSPRTLQRRLRSEGTSFDELLDAARRELLHALESQGVPGKELPFRLGFQDPSALARARRRWQQA